MRKWLSLIFPSALFLLLSCTTSQQGEGVLGLSWRDCNRIIIMSSVMFSPILSKKCLQVQWLEHFPIPTNSEPATTSLSWFYLIAGLIEVRRIHLGKNHQNYLQQNSIWSTLNNQQRLSLQYTLQLLSKFLRFTTSINCSCNIGISPSPSSLRTFVEVMSWTNLHSENWWFKYENIMYYIWTKKSFD